MSWSHDELFVQASNPAIDQLTLQRLAAEHPELHATIAANPQAYPALLDWLAGLGNPAVNAALVARGYMSAGPAMPQAPTAVTKPAVQPHPVDTADTPAHPAPHTVPVTSPEPVAEPQADAQTDSALEPMDAAHATAVPPSAEAATVVVSAATTTSGDTADVPPTEAEPGPEADAEIEPETSVIPDAATTAAPALVSPDTPAAPPADATQVMPATIPPALTTHNTPAEAATMAFAPNADATTAFSTPSVSSAPAAVPLTSPETAAMPPSLIPGLPATTVAQSVAPSGAPQSDDDSPRGRSKNLWLLILGAIVLVLAVAVAVWFFTDGEDAPVPAAVATTPAAITDDASPAAQPTATATASTTPTPTQAEPTPTPTPTPTPLVATPALKAPAPSGAITLSSFSSPSGNISCVLGLDTVSCTINEHNFVGQDSTCSNTASRPFTVVVGKDGAPTGHCSAPFSAASTTLDYGGSAKNDSFACTSAEEGVTCWSQRSGEGFTVARESAASITR